MYTSNQGHGNLKPARCSLVAERRLRGTQRLLYHAGIDMTLRVGKALDGHHSSRGKNAEDSCVFHFMHAIQCTSVVKKQKKLVHRG